MLELNRNIKIDFLQFTLGDVLSSMENENFFIEKEFYLSERQNENKLIFYVRANRMFGSQIQEFNHKPESKELVIRSWYTYKVLPSFSMIFILLMSMVLQLQFSYESWIKWLISISLTLVLGFIIEYWNLKYEAKEIEREIIIRLHDLMRKKGYKVPL